MVDCIPGLNIITVGCVATHPGPDPAPADDGGLPRLHLRAVPPRQLDGLYGLGEGQVRGQSKEESRYMILIWADLRMAMSFSCVVWS